MVKCSKCGQEFYRYLYPSDEEQGHTCPSCKVVQLEKEEITEIKFKTDKIDKVECGKCGYKYRILTDGEGLQTYTCPTCYHKMMSNNSKIVVGSANGEKKPYTHKLLIKDDIDEEKKVCPHCNSKDTYMPFSDNQEAFGCKECNRMFFTDEVHYSCKCGIKHQIDFENKQYTSLDLVVINNQYEDHKHVFSKRFNIHKERKEKSIHYNEETKMKSKEYEQLNNKIDNESAARREQEQILRGQLSRVGENVFRLTKTYPLDKICPYESHLKEEKFKRVRARRETYELVFLLTWLLLISMAVFYILKFPTLLQFYRTGGILDMIGLTVVIILHCHYLQKLIKLTETLYEKEKIKVEERAKELVEKYGLTQYENYLSSHEQWKREERNIDRWHSGSDTAD